LKIIAALLLLAMAEAPPVLTDAQKDKWHQAQAIAISAVAQANEAQRTALEKQQALGQLTNTLCGEGFQIQPDKDDNPNCVAATKPGPTQGRIPARPEKKP
jgi:hypothetical protein